MSRACQCAVGVSSRRAACGPRHLRPDLQCAAAIEYELGWRCQSEVLTIERNQVNLAEGTIRLKPGSTKNDEGRVAYLPERLKGEIQAQLERVLQLEVKTEQVIPYLFPHFKSGRRYRKGQLIEDFRRRGRAPASRPGSTGRSRTPTIPTTPGRCPRYCGTTSGAPPYGTWSTRECPSGWARR
jgi:integrase